MPFLKMMMIIMMKKMMMMRWPAGRRSAVGGALPAQIWALWAPSGSGRAVLDAEAALLVDRGEGAGGAGGGDGGAPTVVQQQGLYGPILGLAGPVRAWYVLMLHPVGSR